LTERFDARSAPNASRLNIVVFINCCSNEFLERLYMLKKVNLVRALAGSLLVLALAGCAAISPEGAATEAPTVEAPAEESVSAGTAAFPVTIEHKFGSTTIESEPQRVVALGFTDGDPVLALGVTPIAVRYYFGDAEDPIFPWADAAAGDAEIATLNIPFGEMNFESIVEMDPDLILAVSGGLTQAEYDLLSQIAPTLPQTDEYVDFGVPWQAQTRLIAQALGKSERAEELIAETEALIAAAAAAHPEFAGKTAAIAFPATDGYFFSGPQHERQRVLTSLGFTQPQELVDLAGDAFYGTISGEQLSLLDTDILIWTVTPADVEAIQSNPLYQTLEVAQEGRDIFLDSTGLGDMTAPALYYSSVLSLPFAVEALVPQLAERLAE
jgi:iron complex transport system substrate-binding protein